MSLPIIVIAYNRPRSLNRLLKSLLQAEYGESAVNLTISIDKSDNGEVRVLCNSFQWPFGKLEIVAHEKHLGLKNHVLQCGDLAAEKDGAILLEDDLVVSQRFYEYACQAADVYHNEPNVAGISLYSYQFTESRFLPFKPLDLGYDTYFMQLASSWGQIWNRRQWADFRSWYEQNPAIKPEENIPSHLLDWGENSWKKHFNRYLIATNRYFVFPTTSYSTNFEDEGAHASTKGLYQVGLTLGAKHLKFDKLTTSGNKYDAWFELVPECLRALNPKLRNREFAVDLYGSKSRKNIKEKLLLTSRSVADSVESWSDEMHPFVQTIVHDIDGSGIALAETASVDLNSIAVKDRFDQRLTASETVNTGINCIIDHSNSLPELLEKTLLSIEAQTSSHWRAIILTNDGQVSDLAKNFRGSISIISTKKPNRMERFHEALPFCNKPFTMFLSSGDTLEPNAIEVSLGILQKHGGVHWLAGSGLASNAFFPMRWRTIKLSEHGSNGSGFGIAQCVFLTEFLWHESVQAAMKSTSPAKFMQSVCANKLHPNRITHPLVRVHEKSEVVEPGFDHKKSTVGALLFTFCSALTRFTKSSLPHLILSGYFHLPDNFRYDDENKTWYRERF